jgi:hyperosmotically inducible protein
MKITILGNVIGTGATPASRRAVCLAAIAVWLVSPSLLLASSAPKTIEEQVRHELVTLPYYGVFDQLAFQVHGGTVTLTGKVTRPVLRSEAESVVRRISGVASVVNKIDVLPVSRFDDGIRLNALRAVYGNSALFRYAVAGAVAPIRIIVENGRLTLEGIVASETDRNVAGLAASGVAGVFSVTNNLRVQS